MIRKKRREIAKYFNLKILQVKLIFKIKKAFNYKIKSFKELLQDN
jgi:hypothetical protein